MGVSGLLDLVDDDDLAADSPAGVALTRRLEGALIALRAMDGDIPDQTDCRSRSRSVLLLLLGPGPAVAGGEILSSFQRDGGPTVIRSRPINKAIVDVAFPHHD